MKGDKNMTGLFAADSGDINPVMKSAGPGILLGDLDIGRNDHRESGFLESSGEAAGNQCVPVHFNIIRTGSIADDPFLAGDDADGRFAAHRCTGIFCRRLTFFGAGKTRHEERRRQDRYGEEPFHPAKCNLFFEDGWLGKTLKVTILPGIPSY